MLIKRPNKSLYKVAVVILIVLLCSVYIIRARHLIFLDTNQNDLGSSIPLLEGVKIEENFYSSKKTEFVLQVRPITWGRQYEEDQYLSISIREKDSEQILATNRVALQDLPDNALSNVFFFDGVVLERNRWYVIEFESNAKEEEASISLMCVELSDVNRSYSSTNGVKNNFDIAMIICE